MIMVDIPICKAAGEGDIAALRACIEQSCNVNAVSAGSTALCRAAGKGHLEACRFLIENGAKPRLPQTPQISALRTAVEMGRMEAVTLLLPYCDPRWEFQAVERAISGGHYDIADFLLQSGKFRFPLDENDSPNIVGISYADTRTAWHWQNFIISRPDRLAALDPL